MSVRDSMKKRRDKGWSTKPKSKDRDKSTRLNRRDSV
jgi:hypothetical protein